VALTMMMILLLWSSIERSATELRGMPSFGSEALRAATAAAAAVDDNDDDRIRLARGAE
jgi:hypothetical protein